MGYYRGDFYRGDYVAGGLGGFFSKVLGWGVKEVTNVIPGGAIVKSAAGAAAGKIVRRVGGAVMKHPVLTAAVGAGVIGAVTGVAGGRATAPGAPLQMPPGRGMHISRKTGQLVRNRHMRVTNPKALRRSLRRVAGFSRFALRCLRITHPHRRGKVVYKFHKKRRAA